MEIRDFINDTSSIETYELQGARFLIGLWYIVQRAGAIISYLGGARRSSKHGQERRHHFRLVVLPWNLSITKHTLNVPNLSHTLLHSLLYWLNCIFVNICFIFWHQTTVIFDPVCVSDTCILYTKGYFFPTNNYAFCWTNVTL